MFSCCICVTLPKPGGMDKLAGETHLTREALYRMLSESGNPQLSSLDKILQTLGLRLTVSQASSV